MKQVLAQAAIAGAAFATVDPVWPNPERNDNRATVGVGIGGWLVLEHWLTPSLFYRFLGNNRSQGAGVDLY